MYRSFSTAIYRIDTPKGGIDIRATGLGFELGGGSGDAAAAGHAKELFDDLAGGARFADSASCSGSISGAIVTAFNPAGIKQSAVLNRIADGRLRTLIRRLGLRGFRSIGIDPAGRWPDEPGFFIPRCSWTAAHGLALAFRQKAFVWLTRDSATVVFVGSPPRLKPGD